MTTSTPEPGENIDPSVSNAEDLEQTDVRGGLDRDPDEVPNADYSDPDTRPAIAPDEGTEDGED